MEILVAGDCIFYVKGLLTEDLCRTAIENYQRDPRRHPGYTVGSRGENKSYDEVKVSTDLGIDSEGVWTAIHEQLHQTVSRVVLSIAAQFPSLRVWPLRTTGYKIQHYRKNEGHFKWHFDALGPGAWERQLAIVIFLNSVEQGGETCEKDSGAEVVHGDVPLLKEKPQLEVVPARSAARACVAATRRIRAFAGPH